MEKLNLYTFGELMEKAKKDGNLKPLDMAISSNNEAINDLSMLQSQDFRDNLQHYLDNNSTIKKLHDDFAIYANIITEYYGIDGNIMFSESGYFTIEEMTLDNDKLYELLKEYGEQHHYNTFQLSTIKYVCTQNLIDVKYEPGRCYNGIDFNYCVYIERDISRLIEPALQELTNKLIDYLAEIGDEIKIHDYYTRIFTVDAKMVGEKMTQYYVYDDCDCTRDWIRDYLDSNGYLFTNEGDFICYQHNLDEGDIL